MSTAANHRKRSHRSQRAHYNASNRIHRRNLSKQYGESFLENTLLGRLIRRIRNAAMEGK